LILKLNEAATRVVGSNNFNAKVQELGVIPASSTPEELAARIRDTTSAFSTMVQRVEFKMP
jgi:tripartite-type tricarboxylate transporter receptor subunit TctC